MQDFPNKIAPCILASLGSFSRYAFLRPFSSKRQSRAVKAAKPSGKRQSRADLGVLGKLYPAVNGRWDTNADNLSLTDMKPKVNYKAGDDILASRW